MLFLFLSQAPFQRNFAVNIIQQGADDYLFKETNLNRLPAAIQQSIEKQVCHYSKEVAEDELKNSREQLRHLFSIRKTSGKKAYTYSP